jgi:hypothetical protein
MVLGLGGGCLTGLPAISALALQHVDLLLLQPPQAVPVACFGRGSSIAGAAEPCCDVRSD